MGDFDGLIGHPQLIIRWITLRFECRATLASSKTLARTGFQNLEITVAFLGFPTTDPTREDSEGAAEQASSGPVQLRLSVECGQARATPAVPYTRR